MTMPTRLLPVSALVGLTMMLAGCATGSDPAMGSGGMSPDSPASGSDGAGTPAPTTTEPEGATETEGENPDEGPSDTADTSTVYGTATVGGVKYDLHELRRCEPSDADQVDRELELTARGFLSSGEGYDGGDWVQLDVLVQQIAGTDLDQVSWAGPEGVFGTDDDAGVSYGGGRVSGTSVMVDSLTLEGSLPVTYDVEVPDEILDCRP